MTSLEVAVRVRPFNAREVKYNSQSVIEMTPTTCTLKDLRNGRIVHDSSPTAAALSNRNFTFDHCFWTHAPLPDDVLDVATKGTLVFADQKFVYEQLGKKILDNCFAGFNSCLFAYGQTGSGKTYSMMGTAIDPGIIPQMTEELYHRAAQNNVSIVVECSYLEIYNEMVRDLLNPQNFDKSLRVRQHPTLGLYDEGLTKLSAKRAVDVGLLLDAGSKVRAVGATQMNATSSRSHAILTLSIRFKGVDGELGSLLNLVDLAGSERAGATGAVGDTLIEGSNINKSLTTLGMCLSRLAELTEGKHKGHIPFRDSQLTWLLNDSLGGNSKTAMLANISPASINYEETLSTLRFAMTAKKIKNNAVVNEDPQQRLIRELRSEIEDIKQKIAVIEAIRAGLPPPSVVVDLNADDDFNNNNAPPPSLQNGSLTIHDVMKKVDAPTSEEPEDSRAEQVKLLLETMQMFEQSIETEEERGVRCAKALASHEEAMTAFHTKNISNNMTAAARVVSAKKSFLPRLVTLNEDLYAFPSLALLYHLKDGANVIGTSSDKDEVLVTMPQDNGKEIVFPKHCVVHVNVEHKIVTMECYSNEPLSPCSTTSSEISSSLLGASKGRRATVTHLASLVPAGPAEVFVNGTPLLPGEVRPLKHLDRIVLGLIAFRHSQPLIWQETGSPTATTTSELLLFDSESSNNEPIEFSYRPTTIEHLELLERHSRHGLGLHCLKKFQSFFDEDLLLNVSPPLGNDLHERQMEENFLVGEAEMKLVSLYPVSIDALLPVEREENDVVAAAEMDVDYMSALKEKETYLKSVLQSKRDAARDQALETLREKSRESESEILRLQEELKGQRRAEEEAAQKRQQEKEEKDRLEAERRRKVEHEKQEQLNKGIAIRQLAKELQAYEEECRTAIMWKPNGPTAAEDCEEYEFSQLCPTNDAVADRGLIIFQGVVQKMRVSHGIFSKKGWHPVTILLRPRFLYYFEIDKPNTKASGACYIFGSQWTLMDQPIDGKINTMRLVPCVPRKPSKSNKSATDENNLLLSFDSAELLRDFVDIIGKLSVPLCPDNVAAYLRQQKARDM